ncbi:MAG: phospholipase D-like domain-containing protein, partial [Giesbergeria sp.]
MKLRPYLATLGLLCMLSACSGLPENVERPVSRALETPASTTLSASVQQQREEAKARSNSGFRLLSGPDDAYGSRLALAEAAEKTLDLQYYAIHADASTARLLRAVVKAARRGVRVRVLLDDFHSTGRDAQVMRLAFEPNIEMRMFNPVAGPRASKAGRIFSAVMDFSRAQQRMHNKLFIADNAMGVTGGRNLGDAYFGNAEAGNFVDLDVLAAGPIVADLSRSFDKYWNNKRAYPVQSLISKEELLQMREKIRAEAVAQANDPADGATQEQAQAVK